MTSITTNLPHSETNNEFSFSLKTILLKLENKNYEFADQLKNLYLRVVDDDFLKSFTTIMLEYQNFIDVALYYTNVSLSAMKQWEENQSNIPVYGYITANLLKIFSCDVNGKIYQDTLNYNETTTYLYKLLGILNNSNMCSKIFFSGINNTKMITSVTKAESQNTISPFLNVKEKIIQVTPDQNKYILYIDTKNPDFLFLREFDLIPFYKYYFATKYLYTDYSEGGFPTLKQILSQSSSGVLRNFLEIFKMKNNSMFDKQLFKIELMLEHGTLDIYYELICQALLLGYCDTYKLGQIVSVLNYKTYPTGNKNFNKYCNTTTASQILDITSVLLKTRCSPPNSGNNTVLRRYLETFLYHVTSLEDILTLCETNPTYLLIVENIGKIVFDVGRQLTINYSKEQPNHELFYVIYYLNKEFKELEGDHVRMYKKHSYEFEKFTSDKLNLSKIKVKCKLLQEIALLNKINKNIIMGNHVNRYYFGFNGELRQIISSKPLNTLIIECPNLKNLLSSYSPNENDLLCYLSIKYVEIEVVQLFLNYKICVTNSMIEKFLLVDNYSPQYMNQNGLVLELLIDSLNEELNKEMINKNLITICKNFGLTQNLIKKLSVPVDDLYYMCHIANTLQYSSAAFLDDENPKYQMRNMMIGRTTVTAFLKFLKLYKLQADNYCYELCLQYNSCKALKDYFNRTYEKTIYLERFYVANIDTISFKLGLHQCNLINRQYMESPCPLIKN